MISINRLFAGGVITNYLCSSECKHCLYGCSRSWQNHYLQPEQAADIFQKIQSLGCFSIHLGGGEPFLDRKGLVQVLDVAGSVGMGIEYIETNSSWYNGDNDILHQIKALGVDTLLLSISPFHNEFIPFKKVKQLLAACGQTGINVFPWMSDFFPDLEALGDDKRHSLIEYMDLFGDDYVDQLMYRYSLTMRGRALKTFRAKMADCTTDEIMATNCSGCSELKNVSHFHIDLYGNYIPGLCTGLAIQCRDLGEALIEEEYPALTLLAEQGIGALLTYAVEKYDFKVKSSYVSKCHLCYDIRHFLVKERNVDTKDLQPAEYYNQLGEF